MTDRKRSPPRSEWLEAFACFAEHLSFTKAARAMHLSQPALHVQVTKLQEALGAPLYAKQGRSLVLTREGIAVLAFARDAEERAAELFASLAGEGDKSTVTLCAGEGAYLYLLGGALRSFARKGRFSLRLLTRDRSGTIDAVRAGEAHLGIAALDAPPEDLNAERLCDVGSIVVMPSAHRLAKKRSIAFRDLDGEPLIAPPQGRPQRTALELAFRSAGAALSVAIEAVGWELCIHFAGLGLGLTIVNDFCRVPRAMVARPLRGLPPARYWVLGSRARRGPGALALERAILEHAKKS